MEIDRAIEILRPIVKSSTALDEFKHFDLTLLSASVQVEAQLALVVVKAALKRGELSEEEFKQKVGLIT